MASKDSEDYFKKAFERINEIEKVSKDMIDESKKLEKKTLYLEEQVSIEKSLTGKKK